MLTVEVVKTAIDVVGIAMGIAQVLKGIKAKRQGRGKKMSPSLLKKAKLFPAR